MSLKKRALFFFAFGTLIQSSSAFALALDVSSFSAPLQLLTDQAAQATAKTLGLGVEFKPLSGIDPPSGPIGFEIGVSAQVAKIPDDFRAMLVAAGYTDTIPFALPGAMVHLGLRLGSLAAVEAGYLKVNQYKLTGIAVKIKIIDPEEGFGAAIRLAYSDNDLDIISSKTWTPAILMGAKLDFAEPYVGVAYSMATSKIEVPITAAGFTQTFSASGKSNGVSAFGGLLFNATIIQIAFEGTYSMAGVSGLAARVGVAF